MRLSRDSILIVASHNPGKVREIRDLLCPYGISVRSAAELNLLEPEESGSSFAENAILKAEAALSASGLQALADDSGLSVMGLAGAPGIYSARWAGPDKNFSHAMERVRHELENRRAADRSAKFVCALALASPDSGTEVFEGEIHGSLQFPPRGDKGFGYDPIFVPEGFTHTFGEMEPARKHAMSHRARAFAKFIAASGLSNVSEP